MKVFVTGASGHVGSALVPELLHNGHAVVGLARSDASAAALEAAGAEVHRGDLSDPDGLAAVAADADGVIHLAYDHAAMARGAMDEALALDRAAIEAMGDALKDTDKPFVGTSGTLMLAVGGVTGRPGTEDDVFGDVGHRVDNENAVANLADRGVRASVVRLPPTVHSDLDRHGFVPMLIALAREKGVSGYIGDGANRWPAGHTLDAARVYRLALESAPARARLHPVGDEGVPFKAIAEAIGAGAGVPAASVEPEALGFLGFFAALDSPATAEKTKALLGWEPEHPTLLEDLAQDHYFATAPATT